MLSTSLVRHEENPQTAKMKWVVDPNVQISRTIADVARFTQPQSRHFQQVPRKKSAAFPRTVALSVSELVQRGRTLSPRRKIPKLSKVERLPCLIRIPALGHQLEDDEGGMRRVQEE
jgi:hypothetical protein